MTALRDFLQPNQLRHLQQDGQSIEENQQLKTRNYTGYIFTGTANCEFLWSTTLDLYLHQYQSVSIMKATLLVLLLSVVSMMVTGDLHLSERGTGPGCLVGTRLAFDLNTTLEETKRLNNEFFDCPNPEPGVPCFFYSHVFKPFFIIEGTVEGESDRFLDSYTFKVVGGGRTRGSVRNYSHEEILNFNSLSDSESSRQTLVWTYDDVPDSFRLTKEGFLLMSNASNRVRWLCQRNSPCGDLTPVNLLDPDFFFIIEVSNRETASSPFCEHTLRFELHAHGFPLDPVRGLFFMQMTMTVIQTILICYIGHTCWRLRQKTVHTKKRDGLDEQDGNQFKAGDVLVKVGSMLHSCFLQLYCIIFRIVQNPMLDHVIMLVVLFDTSTLIAQTFQGVTVRTGWCLSAVDSCLLVFYVVEAVFKILVRGRTYFRKPWNVLDFFIVFMSLLEFTLSLVQSAGGFSSRQASTLFRVLKTLKGARVFRALRLLKAIRFFKGLQAILLTCLQSFRSMSSIIVLMFLFLFIFTVIFREMFNESDPEHFGNIFRTIFTLFQILTLDDWSLIYMTSRDNGAPHIIYFLSLYIVVELFTFLNLFIAVLADNFQLSIRKKRQCKSQKSPDVKEGETQSGVKAVEDLEMCQVEIEEEFHKEALRRASSDSKQSKRKIELISRHLQLLAAMDQHMQKYRSQACLLDNLVETFFTVRSFSVYML
ncbi:hypothetical protein AOLI_G00315940 [Acnodon oligacanthus]